MIAGFSRRLILRRSLARVEQFDDRLLREFGLSRDDCAKSNRLSQQALMQAGEPKP
jgi:hypothetical protein